MSETFGIENVKLVFAFIIEGGDIAGEIASMSGVKWYEKIGPLFKILDQSAGLFKVNWKLFPKELADLTSEEREELKKFFIEKFDIPQDKFETIIEKFFGVALLVVDNIINVVALVKELKSK
jgi:hypothetical protein